MAEVAPVPVLAPGRAPAVVGRDRLRAQLGSAILAVGRHLGMVIAFSLPAVVLWWHAWDGHLANRVACTCGDSGQEVWFMAWPAYALSHGLDPFFSHALYAPHGINLLVNTSAPLVGILLAPLTWTAGPVAATNVALTLAPAVSAWGAWIACRHFTTWPPAAVVGGLLFGYSPFVVQNITTGHVSASVLVVPPIALAVGHDLFVTRHRSAARDGAALGALAVVQFLISPEVLSMMAVVAAVLAVLGAAVHWRDIVSHLARLARAVPAGAVAAAVLAYPSWFMLEGPRHLVGPPWAGIEVLGIVPSQLWSPGAYAAPASALVQLSGYEGAAGPPAAYLGAGLLALAGLGALAAWRRRTTWVLAVATLATVWLSFGTLLWTSPSSFAPGLWLPWQPLSALPVLNRILPSRFTLFTALFVSLLVALGLDAAWTAVNRFSSQSLTRASDRSKRAARRLGGGALVVVAVAAMVPIWRTYQVPFATRPVAEPAWFATAGRVVPPGSVVLSYPFPFPAAGTAQPMVWQAEDGMRFSLAGGYAKAPGERGAPLSQESHSAASWLLAELSAADAGPLPQGTPSQIGTVRQALSRWHVSYVVVTHRGRDPRSAVSFFTAVIGRPPTVSHGAWVWHLPG